MNGPKGCLLASDALLFVCFPGVRRSGASSGKGFFCRRLGASLETMGCRIVDDASSADIQVHNFKIRTKARGLKIVRFAGVNHDVNINYKRSNAPLSTALQACDGVVYQSQHAKRMCDRYLGAARVTSAVIFNGADQAFAARIKPADRLFPVTYIAFSRWRRFKRLPEIIEAFLAAGVPESGLIIAGDVREAGLGKRLRVYKQRKDIVFLGKLSQEALASHLKNCVASIHLSPFEGCPNSVVEALVAGVPVICTNIGGTPEIVGPSGGTVCSLDKPYDGSPVDLKRPPKIDISVAAKAIFDHRQSRSVRVDHVRIDVIASKYLDFFKRVLRGRTAR